MSSTTELTGPLKDPSRIAQRAGLPESVGDYADMILDRLREDNYQIPADARTFAATVYVAARDEGEPVTAGEIADAGGVQETAISREFRRVVEELGISPELVSPERFLDRFTEELDVPENVASTAVDLFRQGEEANLWANRTGAVSASMCLYASAVSHGYDELTQKDFEEFGVSRTSIRKGYKQVLELLDGEEAESGKMNAPEDTEALFEAVESIHDEVGVPDAVLDDARDILEQVAGDEWVLGKSASPIAAGAYWLAAEQNRLSVSQAEVADAADSHKVTVNRRVGAIRENTDAHE